ncbi:hypothetical protein pipiens_004596 [Culex pipiens pipiens]|uniref:Uncharacterized protein n=1 Tax=Culex pipiens pipiens TaxID=38569 RepID=A0ABD1CH70_CULPP
MTACKNKPVFVVLFGQLIDFVRLQAKVSLFTTEDRCQSYLLSSRNNTKTGLCSRWKRFAEREVAFTLLRLGALSWRTTAPPTSTICYSDRGRRWGIPYAILEGCNECVSKSIQDDK